MDEHSAEDLSPSIDLLPLELDDDVIRELFELPNWVDSLFNEIPIVSSDNPPTISAPSADVVNTPSDDVLRELLDIPNWIDSLLADGSFGSGRPTNTNSPSSSAVSNTSKIPQIVKRKLDYDSAGPSSKIRKVEPQPHCSKNPPPVLLGSGEPSLPFEIISDERRRYQKFQTDARWTTLSFRKPTREEDIQVYLRTVFGSLLTHLPQRDVQPGDRIGLTILNSARPEQRAIGVSLRRADQLSADVILQTIEKILQSNEDFFMDGQLLVSLG